MPKIPRQIHSLELTIKRSRFVATVMPLTSPEQAAALLADRHDTSASHHCWAWQFDAQYRSDDDGEPGGTAGRPILAAITAQGFDHTLVVGAALVRRHQAGQRRPGARLWRQRGKVFARDTITSTDADGENAFAMCPRAYWQRAYSLSGPPGEHSARGLVSRSGTARHRAARGANSGTASAITRCQQWSNSVLGRTKIRLGCGRSTSHGEVLC